MMPCANKYMMIMMMNGDRPIDFRRCDVGSLLANSHVVVFFWRYNTATYYTTSDKRCAAK